MSKPNARPGFTLIELLVVIAVLAVLSAILFPVFTRAKESAKRGACLSNMRQIGVALALYLGDNDGYLPDRRDLKVALPGGFRPWTSWPPSDPRAGWTAELLSSYLQNPSIWVCPSIHGTSLESAAEVRQFDMARRVNTSYWLWRFDRMDDPVPLDNLWGKSEEQAVFDLQTANNPQVGFPESTAEVELMVDPYFPGTVPSVKGSLKRRAVHTGGRNRLFLDFHARYIKDARTSP